MKKIFVYFKTVTMFIFIMILLSALPVSYNRTFSSETKVSNFLVENVKEDVKEEEVLAVIQEKEEIVKEPEVTEVKEEVKVVEKKEEKKETNVESNTHSVTTNTVEKKETIEKEEDKFNLGSISINNSNFKKDIIKDDGSYFYLNHNLNGKYNGVGMPIIDVRTDFTTRKTLMYAHSAKNGKSPFNYLQNYHNNESFYKDHKYITITYDNHTYKYEIFSVYVSLADDELSEGLEYFRKVNYNNSEWDDIINWYKRNSEYDTGVSVSENDKILILQTCSMDDKYYQKYYRANLLVMAKLIEG